MSEQEQLDYLELNTEETLRAARHFYAQMPVVVVFGLLDDGTVHTVATPSAETHELLWAAKAMEVSMLMGAEDPYPLDEQNWHNIQNAKDLPENSTISDAYDRMKHCANALVVALDEEGRASMLYSKDVDFMLINFCAEWFKFQLLSADAFAQFDDQLDDDGDDDLED